MTWALAAACGIASIPAGLRWLRVAQREHYLAPSTTRFALRWWGFGAINRMLAFVAFVGVIGVLWSPRLGFLVALAQIGPVGLSLRGRTSPLAWTPRLRRLAVTSGVLVALAYLIGGLTQSPFVVVVGLFALPALVDVALMALTPVEKSLGDQWVIKAASRLKSSGADVVAITGSYGKTTTKGYVVHLLSGSKRVVASPASFNNRMGLARAINEQLVPGTQVFVAEMGTYGPGEIADLCEWIPPKVAAIVAVGPVHLERFKTEERIVSAKSEILDNAGVGVIAVDNHLLADLADSRSSKMDVMTAGTGDTEARVVVRDRALFIDGVRVADVGGEVLGVNLAVAVGICLALEMSVNEIIPRLADLPVVEHRQTVRVTERGVTIIDDTYNSNPDGVASALDTLARVGGNGRRAVVTPGMVELGPRQQSENVAFARRAATEVDDLVIVGGTNRGALLDGSSNGSASVTVVGSREEAVVWVRENLVSGDVVLYENDLPDHYP